MTFRADLHSHSTASDGTYSPSELIAHALSIGLKGLSITDHDTVEGYEEAFKAITSTSLQLLPGIEFSTEFQGKSVHLLGYSFNLQCSELLEFCAHHHKRRHQRCEEIIERLHQLGYPITLEEVLAKANHKGSIGRPHFAQVLVEKGYFSSIREAFSQLLGDHKPCFVPSRYPSTEETIALLHRINAFALIAHPHLLEPSLAKKLIELPWDGVEAYYARFSLDKERPWINLAKKKKWLYTGGSDFHGDAKENNALGCSWTVESQFEKLKERWEENK